MEIVFDKEYLQELYLKGKSKNKKYRFQPDIIRKYIDVINLMKNQENVLDLRRFNSLNYEKLKGDMSGISSVRINNKYRIEFQEIITENKTIATICNIIELSNHYK